MWFKGSLFQNLFTFTFSVIDFCTSRHLMRFVAAKLALAGVLSANVAMLTLPAHANVEAGAAVFQLKCVACHEQGGNSLNPTKTLKASRLDSEQIASLVSNGKGQMPSYGPKAPPFARLTDEQVCYRHGGVGPLQSALPPPRPYPNLTPTLTL